MNELENGDERVKGSEARGAAPGGADQRDKPGSQQVLELGGASRQGREPADSREGDGPAVERRVQRAEPSEAARLAAPNEAQLGSASNAYVEIEQRAAALQELKRSPQSQREDEPNGTRWAREDLVALPHVREGEREVALDAIGRGMEANRSYAATVRAEAADVAASAEAVRAERSGRGQELADTRPARVDAEAEAQVSIRERREASYTSMEAETAREWARLDLEDLRKIKSPERLDDAAIVIADNMRNEPAYKDEFKRADSEAARAVEMLAAQAGDRLPTEAAKEATLSIDDATAERLAAVRERDRDEALVALGLKRKEGDVDKAFVEDLDSRMAKSELEELGWRNREDLDDVMRDLERLAHKDWHKAASLWDKYRPNDIDKPVFIDGDDIDAKRSPDAKREAANDDKVSASERGDTEAEFMTPASIRKRFLQAEDKFYYREDDNKLAFEDKGQRLATAHNDPDVIRSMVELAEAKGWTSIKVKGTEDFKREAWLQASLKGLEVQGFQPKDVDLAKLEDLRKETDRKSERGLNSIERSPERARSTEDRSDVAPVRAPAIDEQHHNLSKQQLAAIDALKGVMRGRGDSDKAVEMAASIAAERFQTSRVYTGKVLEHGEAPFEFAKDNKESYYVKLQTPQGERTVWGVDLPRAMAEGQVKVGDDVALAYQGKQPVTVKEPVKDEAGKVVGEREVVTHRNAWDMRRLEAIREEARERLEEAAGRAERQPLVKVYDRDAQRSEQRTQVVRQQERDTERARG